MKVYIVAATLALYCDALRALGLHERAAVHVLPGRLDVIPAGAMVYVATERQGVARLAA